MVTNKKIKFKTKNGLYIVGRLFTGNKSPKQYALYAPCFTCGKDIHLAKRLSEKLAEFDIATLSIDFRGLGDSEGNFSETNFTTQIEDVQAAYKYMTAYYKQPHFLIGHSLGGTVAVVAASLLPQLGAVITINAPSDPHHVGRHFSALAAHLDPDVATEIKIADRTFMVKPNFLIDLQKYDMSTVFHRLTAKLLILHAADDKVVNISNAYTLLNGASPPKGFICLDSPDHMLATYDHINYIAGLINEWVKIY